MSDAPQGNIVPAIAPKNRELGGINQATCQHRWAFNRFGGYDYWCQDCLIPGRLVENLTPGQSWWPANHPHANKARSCPKCHSPRVSLPAYNEDFFDCLDCGHSWPQTEKQTQFMRTHPAGMYDEQTGRYRREAIDVIVRTLLGEVVVTNDRVLNHALSQAASIIGRKDISPLDKFETLTAFVLKARRELLGKADE